MIKVTLIIILGLAVYIINIPIVNLIGIFSFFAMFLYAVIGKDIRTKKSLKEILLDDSVS